MISKERLQELIKNEKIVYLKFYQQIIGLKLNNKWYIDGCYLCKEIEWLNNASAKHNLLDLYETEQAIEEEKFETISTLKQENQAFKDRWQKLKAWVVKEQGYASMHQLERLQTLDEIKDIMQDLEKVGDYERNIV